MKSLVARSALLAWALIGPGALASATAADSLSSADRDAAFDPRFDGPASAYAPLGFWPVIGPQAALDRIDTAAEEIVARLAAETAAGGAVAQGPSIPSFEALPPSGAPETPAETPGLSAENPTVPSLPLPPADTVPGKPSPAAKACLFAAASTLPLVPDARITSASAAPMGSMANEGLYRDFRVILIVDALGMTTTVEFLCRSADTPEIFGAEILSARILE